MEAAAAASIASRVPAASHRILSGEAPEQPGEHLSRPHLQVAVVAGRLQRCHLVRPAHAGHHLPHAELDAPRRPEVTCAPVTLAYTGRTGSANGMSASTAASRSAAFADQRRVERPRHLQGDEAAGARLLARRFGVAQAAGRAGQHHLPRAGVIGDEDRPVPADRRSPLPRAPGARPTTAAIPGAAVRGIGGAAGRLHRDPALAGDREDVGRADHPRQVQRRVFAQAEAGEPVAGHAMLAEHDGRGQVGKGDRDLSAVRGAQFLLSTVEQEAPQVGTRGVGSDLEQLLDRLAVIPQITGHPRVLGALRREQETRPHQIG